MLTATLALMGCVAVDKPDEDDRATPGIGTPSSTAELSAGSPTPSPTPEEPSRPGSALDAALAAAGAIFGVETASECTGEADCIQPSPGARESAEHGIAPLAYVTGGGGGAIVAMGRDADGAWGLWLATQGDDPQVVAIPGELLICGDAENLALRSEPREDAAESGQIAREQTVDALTFVLTEPGTVDEPGNGWYEVSGQASGWISSSDVVAADPGDCSAGSEDGGSGPVG